MIKDRPASEIADFLRRASPASLASCTSTKTTSLHQEIQLQNTDTTLTKIQKQKPPKYLQQLCIYVQLSLSSRGLHGGAYFSDVSG